MVANLYSIAIRRLGQVDVVCNSAAISAASKDN